MTSNAVSRRNPFFPRIFAVAAIVVLVLPVTDDTGFRYFAVAWLAALPWVLYALDVRFGVSHRDGENGGGNDMGGYSFGESSVSGDCGDGGGGGDC